MNDLDLEQNLIPDPQIRNLLVTRHPEQALELASQQAAAGLAYQAVIQFALDKNLESAINILQHALNISPGSQIAFHNLVAILLGQGRLKNKNLSSIKEFWTQKCHTLPWLYKYRRLLYSPGFINLECVSGKCNLKCRMCLGANGEHRSNHFDCLSAEDFETILKSTPTVSNVTLSSGDSEPLLHPQLDRLIAIAKEYGVLLDIYTNGQLLTARICRRIVDSQTVLMINFSIDAATAETYRKIRGNNLERLVKKIEMLQDMKRDKGYDLPWVSFSFVAMADTIQELPEFVDMARRLGAKRVFVEDLIGWDDRPSANHIATDNPRCFEYISEAGRRAKASGIKLQLPSLLVNTPSANVPNSAKPKPLQPAYADLETSAPTALPEEAPAKTDTSSTEERLLCCNWIGAVWIRKNGQLEPCCAVRNVADMGNIKDGPLMKNEKYTKVKDLLLEGKVFEACTNKRMCPYVQQQLAAGIPLRIITRQELGDLHPV